MDPNQNDPNSGNSNSNQQDYGAGSAPVNSWQQNNENQTPAYNNTDYWNQGSITSNETNETTAEVSQPETVQSSVVPEVENTTNENPWNSQTTPVSENSWAPATQPETTPSNPWVTTEAKNETQETPVQQEPEAAVVEKPSTPVSKPPSSSSNALMILMVALVVVLLGSTGLFAFQNYQLRQQTKGTPTPQASVIPTPTPSADPTADWKTYENKEKTYSFKYPADWQVVVPPSEPKHKELQIFTNVEPPQSFLTKNPMNLDQTNKSVIKIGDVDVTRIKNNKDVYHREYAIVPFEKGSLIIMGTLSVTATTEEIQIFDSIISTFKFNGLSTSASPISSANCSTGFEKFTNANFSFCYPTGMTKTAASTDTSVVLENSTETLKVVQNFQGGWGGSPCLAINAVEVAGYKSKRLSWKTEKTTGTGCETTFTSFATMVNEGIFKSPFPYMLEYSKKTGTFADDKNFITIESSFTPAKQ